MTMKHLLFFLTTAAFFANAHAQFSSDAANPLAVCAAANSQGSVKAVNDDLTSTGGSFVFWIDRRVDASGNYELYGQRLDKDGNIIWENDGRLIITSGLSVSNLTVVKWQQGLLLCYVLGTDSISCAYLDSNGHNKWAAPVAVASKDYNAYVLGVSAAGCLEVFPTSTGAAFTYYITYFGGSAAIGYNKIDFNGNVLLGNNAVAYTLSGYDYRSISDGADGAYLLSKGNGLGSTITIDRINSSGGKLWGTGVEITDGGGSLGFAGDISMNVSANHDLYVTWDSYNGNVQHTKVLNSGSLAWAFKRLSLSTYALPNAGRCHARIANNDSVFATWVETPASNANVMIQKIGIDGGLSLPAGGKILGVANGYYVYPKVALGNGGADGISFFSTPTTTVAVGAQGIKPDNSLLWSATKILCDAYSKWNFYQDFVVLDDEGDCNTIFWTGFDGNIYGANTCKIADVMPIKTGSLKAENFGMRNKISWAGYNQGTSDSYEVERSFNGINFISLATIQAKGIDNNYAFWDEHPVTGNNFYRIKLHNAAGKTEYSNVVKVNVSSTQLFSISAYPNPVINILNINLSSDTAKNATITICDMAGKMVKTITVNANAFTVDMTRLLRGVYFIKYKDDNKSAVVKVEKY